MLGVAILIFMRLRFGYYWPLPPNFGFGIMAAGVMTLLFHFLIPIAANPTALRRQAVYSDIWMIFLGLWFLFSGSLGIFGFVLLIAVAAALWPLSHLQLLRLQNEH